MGNLSHVNEKLRLLNMGKKPVLDQIRDAIAETGLPVPDSIKIDGTIHRFSTNSKPKDDAGWYVFHNGGVVWGAFGCNRTFGPEGRFTFQQDMGRNLTPVEQLNIERQKVKLKEDKEAAKAETRKTWEESKPASPDHTYLVKKRLVGDGLKQVGEALIIPYLDADKNIAALEKIFPDGSKRSQGSRKDCYGLQGEPQPFQRAYLCEGFADAATAYQVLGVPCAFSGGTSNLKNAAVVLKALYPETVWTIISDNDSHGKGKQAAQSASEATGWPVVMPTEQGQDISDVYLAGGDLGLLLLPEKPKTRSLADILKDTAPTRWLIKNYIPRASLGMLHGPSAGGKSFLTVDIAMSIAVGKSHWQGCKVRQGRVLCLSGEGQGGFVRRLQAWCQKHEVSEALLDVYDQPLDLDTPQGLADLIAVIESLPEPPALIIIDTLHCYYAGDENSSKDARAMINNLKAVIARYETTVLVVHHTGLGEGAQQRARGSSAWRGALDFELNLQPGKDGEPIKVQHMKSKDGRLMPDFFVTIEPWALKHRYDEDGEQEYSAVIEPAEKPMPAVPKETPMQRLEAAWWWAGAQWVDDVPVIEKKQLVEFLHTQRDMTERSAIDQIKPSVKRGIVGRLLDEDKIAIGTHKISIKSDEICSKLRIKSITQKG